MLDEDLALMEEAKKRDHRKIGKGIRIVYVLTSCRAGVTFMASEGSSFA